MKVLKLGWYVNSVETDLSKLGNVPEFIKKEGKWFNFVNGGAHGPILDGGDFSVQGIGITSSVWTGDGEAFPQISISVDSDYVNDPTNTGGSYQSGITTFTDASDIITSGSGKII